MTSRTKFLLIAFLLVSTILVVYRPALQYDFIGLDDDELVVRNPDIKAFNLDSLQHILTRHYITLYVPATMLSYAIDYQIWHLTPFGFRFTNLVIHFFNALLVFYLIWLIQKKYPIALLVAFIFAVHPVQIESVIWIAERKNVLSSFFLLSAVIFYWKANLEPDREGKWLASSFGVFILGLLSKPSVVVFPLIVAFMNHFLCEGRQLIRKRALFYVLVLVSCLAATGVTIFGTATDVEKYAFHGGSYWTNLCIMSTVFWKYWLLLLFPYHQNILYSTIGYKSILNLPVLFSALGFMWFLFFLRVLSKWNKEAAFWFAWFLVSLIPVSNLIAPLPSIMNDRYLYIPMIGFFAGSAVIIRDLIIAQRVQNRIAGKTVAFAAVLFLVPFVFLTFQRIPDWKSAETLWQSALRRAPRQDSRIYYYYGINQLDKGNFKGSVALFKQSLALHASTDTLLALGTACVAAEQYEEAEEHLKKVIEQDPKRSGAYDQLGVTYRKTNRFEEAKPLFEQAIKLQPRNAVLYNNYALLLMDMNEPEKARGLWERALELDPDCHFALRNLAWFHYLRKEWEPAAHYLLRYLRRDPTDKQMRNLAPIIESQLPPEKTVSLSK